MKLPAWLKQKELLLFLLLFSLVLISRLYYLGPSLWHPDAFNFVNQALNLAIEGQYNNAHSTGYPIWIIVLAVSLKSWHGFTGQWSLIFIPNLISVLFGSLLIIPIYRLAKKLLENSWHALIATTAVLINPIIWRWSVVAMSDISALFFALLAVVFFLDFTEKKQQKYLWFSNLCFYLTLMTRLLYGLLLITLAMIWFYQHQPINLKKSVMIFKSWIITLLLVGFSYALFNQFDFAVLFKNYGSTFPNFEDVLGTITVSLNSLGPAMIFLLAIGGYYLYLNNKKIFILLTTSAFIFIVYLATWFKAGAFDIERYALIVTVILILIATYSLKPSRTTRILFGLGLIISLGQLWWGVSRPADQYNVYAHAQNFLAEYPLKASQLAQQKSADAELETYQELAKIINYQDVVFYWHKNWAQPQLILAGAQLLQQPTMVSIESVEKIREKLKLYQNQRIFLLPGAYDIYLLVANEYKPPQAMKLTNQATVNFIPAN